MKFIVILAWAVALASASTEAISAPLSFRAPHVAPVVVALPAPEESKAATAAPNERGALRVGDVRPLAKSVTLARWEPADGGFVARLRARSPTAQGLRVRLDLGMLPGTVQLRAQGSGSGPIETMVVDPALATEAWTPWTEGEEQLVELYSPIRPAADAVSVGGVLHTDTSPYAKAAASCTLSTACTSGDPALDAQIAERKRSLMRINFISGGRGLVCSATLIDTPQRPAPYVLTANHCVTTAAEANTVTSLWFYEQDSCGGNNKAGAQVAGGMQLVFTNFNVDSTLLRMSQPPPEGATFAPLDPNLVANSTPVVSISHPTGDSSRWADGSMEGQYRPTVLDVPYNMYYVRFSRGLIQGGSSGSGLFTRGANGLALTGVLSLGPIDDSCAASSPKYGVYGRLEAFYPQIAQYIGATSPAADDVPNRPSDVTASVSAAPLDTLAQPVSVLRRIDYAGDVDVYRFTLSAPTLVTLYTEGNLDLVSTILDSDGVSIEANDDAQTINTNTGITRRLDAGTYYVHIADWVPTGTGPYTLVLRTDRVDTNNLTALWWDASEPGWGLNLNHQGNIVFATLFTYDDDGAPMWLVMSGGTKQDDGSYLGTLRRTTGPPFNSTPWGAYSQVEVGTMRLTFFGPNAGSLSYSVNGRQVAKQVTRLNFKAAPECSWSHFDRSYQENSTDIWWNDAEPGWGINLVHQENTVFATLFTYGADRRDLWLLMSDGKVDSGGSVSGDLYRTRGPRFDSQQWGATPIQYTKVGTMAIDFEDGNKATLRYTVDGVSVTKSMTRGVFASPKTRCVQG
jgi:hypothetical protein